MTARPQGFQERGPGEGLTGKGGPSVLGCRVLFGEKRGDEIREMVEKVTGSDCPCIKGLRCPLVPLEAQRLVMAHV